MAMGNEALIVTMAVIPLLLCMFVGVGNSRAQQTSVPAPPIPEFTVTYVGQGNNSLIILVIKNEPYSSYVNPNDNQTYLAYFNVQATANARDYEQNWSDLYFIEDVPRQSNNDYTALVYPASDGETFTLGNRLLWELPPGSQVSFQTEAMLGYIYRIDEAPYYPYAFNGTESGWSNTETITIPGTTPTPSVSSTIIPTISPNPTPTPTPAPISTPTPSAIVMPSPTQTIIQSVPTWLYVLISALVVIIAVLLSALLLVLRRKQKLNP